MSENMCKHKSIWMWKAAIVLPTSVALAGYNEDKSCVS